MRRENNTVIPSSVPDREENEDWTEAGPRPVQPIFWDQWSRFGPVDRPVGRSLAFPNRGQKVHLVWGIQESKT